MSRKRNVHVERNDASRRTIDRPYIQRSPRESHEPENDEECLLTQPEILCLPVYVHGTPEREKRKEKRNVKKDTCFGR